VQGNCAPEPGGPISTQTQKTRLSELIDDFQSAMLVTHDEQGALRARPMAVASIEEPDVIWFATLQDSGKVDELRKDSRVAVTFQGSARQVSIAGLGEVVIDAKRIDAMWKESWRVWFPDGKDSDIALVKVTADHAEVWQTSLEDAAGFLLDAGKTLLGGESKDSTPGEHRTVNF